jgi:hypothetical protein
MSKASFVWPALRSFLTACATLSAFATASAAPTAVSELPREFWGKECIGSAPSKTYPSSMWYVLLRVGADGKQVETWTSYGTAGSETKQSVATKGSKTQVALFTAWGDGSYLFPVNSPRTSPTLIIKITGNQVQFATSGGVIGKADCETLP